MTDLAAPALCGPFQPGMNPAEWAAEPKLDGMRLSLHITRDGIHAYGRADSTTGGVGSRDGYLIAVEAELAPFLDSLDDTVLDGEAVIFHGNKADFNATMRIMGSGRDKAIAAQNANTPVSFAAWDVTRLRGTDTRHLTYVERRSLLEEIGKVVAVPHLIVVPNQNPVVDFNESYRVMTDLCGEGAVFKRLNSRYPFGRTSDWQKRKITIDADVVVTGAEMAKPGKFAGLIGAVTFGQIKDGVLTERGKCSGMSDAMRREITANLDSYVGRVMTITYNGFSGGDGFRHPQFTCFRPAGDKAAADCTWDASA